MSVVGIVLEVRPNIWSYLYHLTGTPIILIINIILLKLQLTLEQWCSVTLKVITAVLNQL